MFVPTELFNPGDMITFWDKVGIFMGVATTDEIANITVDQAKLAKDSSIFITITFYFEGAYHKSHLNFGGSLQFAPGAPSEECYFLSRHFEFVKLLIDSTIKILPRIKHSYFSYDDKLRIVQHIFQTD
jgi:hypothetical protein